MNLKKKVAHKKLVLNLVLNKSTNKITKHLERKNIKFNKKENLLISMKSKILKPLASFYMFIYSN